MSMVSAGMFGLAGELLAQSDAGVIEAAGDLGAAPFWVLGVYLLILLTLGIFGWLKSRIGEEDYYLAGREQGWIVSSLTIMATFFSSFALLGAPGLVYKEGVALALFSLNVPFAGLCVYLLGSRIWMAGRALGYVTPGDMVADYYGSRRSLRLLVALTGVLYAVPYVVMQIQAGGILSQKLFSEDSFATGAILLASVTTLYIMIGGMRSVAWTDLIQGSLLVFGMLVSGLAMFLVFEGPANFSRSVTEELPASSLTVPGNTGGWPWSVLFTVCLLSSTGSMVQPAQWMRFYSASSVQTLKRAAIIFAAVLTTCFMLGVMLIGMAGQVLYPLQQTYQVSLAGDGGQMGPAALSGEVPENLAEHFRYIPPKTGVTATPGVLSWSWSLKSQPVPLTEADRQQLASLSSDPAFRSAVDQLAAQVQYPSTRPLLIPHPLVDPDPTDRADFDSILVTVLYRQLPQLLPTIGAAFASLILVAIMAASMSTADSNLHALSAVLTRDVYDQFIRPEASETERVWVGRAIIVIATIAALAAVILGRNPAVAVRYEFMNMIAMMGLMAIAFSAQLLPLTIDMLFLHRGTGRGAAAGLAAGLLGAFLFGPLLSLVADSTGFSALLALRDGVTSIKSAVQVDGTVWGLLFNIPVFVAVSLVTTHADVAKTEQFRRIFSRKSS